MDPLRRWIAFTCRKNPAFPLSTLLLVLGLWLLSGEEEADAANLLGIAAGLGVLGAFLVALIGLAAFVLWPRRVHYETASALRVFSVFRYALPFVVTSYAVDGGDPLAAIALGGVVVAFVGLNGELAVRKIGIRLDAWERQLDCGLYALAALGFPLLAHGLAFQTGPGEALSFAGARAATLGVWWVLALLLLPLTLGLGQIAPAGPLRSRLPALTWRGVALLLLPALCWHALWTAGQEAPLLGYLPLLLVLLVAVVRGARSLGYAPVDWVAYAPAAALLLTVLPDEAMLLGRAPVLSQPLAVVAFAPLAAGACLLIAPQRLKHGLGAVGLVLAFAPLAFARSWHESAAYVLAAGLVLIVIGLTRRDGALVAHGTLASVVCATFLLADGSLPLAVPALVGALLTGTLIAVAPYDRPALVGTSAALLVVPWGTSMAHGLADPAALGAVPVGVVVALCAWRAGRRGLVWLAGGCAVTSGLRAAVPWIGPGVVLVLLGFAGLPLGAWVGIRREQRATAVTS